MAVPERLKFGEYQLDPASGELRGPTGTARLQPQPARVLTLLLLARGELVTREALQRELWPDTHVEVDQGLNYCIRQIRAALGDTSEAPRFIETLPRRGYRFLEALEVPPAQAAQANREASGTPPLRRWQWTAALAALVALAVIVWLVGARRQGVSESPLRLALFPLAFPGRPAVMEEVALTDSLLVSLTRLGGDRVEIVGPVSTRPLVDSGQPFRDIAQQLGAELLVDGGLRPDGDLFLELLRTADGAHLWAKRRPLAELAEASDQLAAEILAVATGARDQETEDEVRAQKSAQSSSQSAGKEKRAPTSRFGAPSP